MFFSSCTKNKPCIVKRVGILKNQNYYCTKIRDTSTLLRINIINNKRSFRSFEQVKELEKALEKVKGVRKVATSARSHYQQCSIILAPELDRIKNIVFKMGENGNSEYSFTYPAPEKVGNYVEASSRIPEDVIKHDLGKDGKFRNRPEGDRIRTRFPPEPNGYLHIGHCKAIVLYKQIS